MNQCAMKKAKKSDTGKRQLSVMMPNSLYLRTKRMAELEKRSLTQQIIFLLEGVLPPVADDVSFANERRKK